MVLMLDTCYSGHGGNELIAAAIITMTRSRGDNHGSGLAVITSAQPFEQAGAGAFPRLLPDAVGALRPPGATPRRCRTAKSVRFALTNRAQFDAAPAGRIQPGSRRFSALVRPTPLAWLSNCLPGSRSPQFLVPLPWVPYSEWRFSKSIASTSLALRSRK